MGENKRVSGNKQGKKKNKDLVIVIGVIIVAVIIIAILAAIRNNKANNDQNNVNTNPATSNSQTGTNEEFTQTLSDGSKLNTSTALSATKSVDGLQVSNIQLKTENGITTLLADVENTTSSDTPEKMITITFVDKDGNKITDLSALVQALKAGESTQLNTSVTSDVSNAYDFTVSTK